MSDIIGADLLETVSGATGAGRHLTTKEKVKALIEETSTAYDALFDALIGEVSDDVVASCRLEEDTAGALPTFGAEALRATWRLARGETTLLLPWRVKVAVTSVVADGVTLSASDYRLNKIGPMAGELQRWASNMPACWGCEVVVTMTCGWSLPAGVPPGLEGKVIDQVRLKFAGRKRDLALRAITTNEVGSESYAVPGGDSIDESGLAKPLMGALTPYRRIVV